MQTISPSDAKMRLDAADTIVVDIRSEQEFKECHVPGAVLLPEGKIDANLARLIGDKNAIFYCTSGARTDKAAQDIENAGFKKAEAIAGGLNAWAQKGLPTVQASGRQTRISIQRQVQLTVGVMIIALAVASLTTAPAATYVIAAIGAGLTFAGLTGTCALAKVLMAMPWNRAT